MRIAIALVFALACSRQDGRVLGDVASCNLGAAGNCREYNANNLAAGSDHLAKLCGIAKTATFSMVPCPTANMTGRCTQQEHTDVYYASFPIPANELEMACTTSGGRFTAPSRRDGE
ncbi:MAG: hypothetical protein ACKV2T_07055 [Kofleriaceae bacterium]